MKKLLGALLFIAVVWVVIAVFNPAPEPLKLSWEQINSAVNHSDDYDKYSAIFINAADRLIQKRRCTLNELREFGGWVRSTRRSNTYFTYCGGYTTADRIYLNVITGKLGR